MQAASRVEAQRAHFCPGFVNKCRPRTNTSASTVCVQIGHWTQPFCILTIANFAFEVILHLPSHRF
jgi:hypothetical protein